ncbi:MAG: hypothetical protein PHH73_01960 [Candidatus Rickettsiella isopodorum]|nr:hypothetical protein [Candidatus Rickettsiella isopodorum]
MSEIKIKVYGVEMDVDYNYKPLIPGHLTGRPENCYIVEPAEVEINSVSVRGIDIFELIEDSKTIDIITNKIIKFEVEQ